MDTPPDAQAPAPGWYPDPQGTGGQRWWDGTQWTNYQQGGAVATAGGATMQRSDDKTWAIMAHLSAILAMIVGLAFLGPLVVYLVKKDESPFVRAHAAAALNFQLSWLIWGLVTLISGIVLLIVFIGALLILVFCAGAIAWLVFTILAAVKAGNGEQPMKYPLTISFVS